MQGNLEFPSQHGVLCRIFWESYITEDERRTWSFRALKDSWEPVRIPLDQSSSTFGDTVGCVIQLIWSDVTLTQAHGALGGPLSYTWDAGSARARKDATRTVQSCKTAVSTTSTARKKKWQSVRSLV